MNEFVSTRDMKPAASGWERPTTGPDASLSNRTGADIQDWWGLIDRVIDTATANGWTKAEVARRIGMADGTFSQWASAKYSGRLDEQNRKVAQWLDAVEESAGLAAIIPQSPTFIATRTANEITRTLNWAQTTADLVLITYAAGMGKTEACRHFRATRPHVHMATMSPYTKTVHGMLVELAAELDVMVHNPAKLTRAIGKRLQNTGGGTLLIVDEAQNLTDEAVNQLRHFVDVYRCGVALVGNDEVYRRFAQKDGPNNGPSNAQLRRRVGMRLKRDKPPVEDLHKFIAAWGITEQPAVKLLVGIGLKGGALGQIDKTLKLASMQALGSGKSLSVEHIEAAWKNRDVEELA